VLGIDHHRLAAGELREVDAVVAPVEAQDRPVVTETLLHHALAGADLVHQVDRALFQHAGADGGLNILAAANLQYDRRDALQVQHLRQQQARGSGSDDGDLGMDALGAGLFSAM
jgi:hypothetical protein